nr:deoxyribose-phosphate aldolase [Legionella sp. PL877]
METDCLKILRELEEGSLKDTRALSIEAISLIDLTLLDESADSQALDLLTQKANCHLVAAICVLPQHLERLMPAASIKKATVINFPEGTQSTHQVLTSIEKVITKYVIDEIDYVFPYQSYLGGEKEFALAQCQQAYRLCEQQKVTFKVILETGAFPSLVSIYNLSTEIINNGCNFLKTSTGKITQGATPSAAFALLRAIKDSGENCGIKVSGGIKKPEQAFLYMRLAKQVLNRKLEKSWFRIGASSLLDELVSYKVKV